VAYTLVDQANLDSDTLLGASQPLDLWPARLDAVLDSTTIANRRGFTGGARRPESTVGQFHDGSILQNQSAVFET
jgi:hypothetical protein